MVFFFFQAEDGIRDWSVTGVQTCALPIYFVKLEVIGDEETLQSGHVGQQRFFVADHFELDEVIEPGFAREPRVQIGRASCRERVERSVLAEAGRKKTPQKRRTKRRTTYHK